MCTEAEPLPVNIAETPPRGRREPGGLCGGIRGEVGKMKKSSCVNEHGNMLLIAEERDTFTKVIFTVCPNFHPHTAMPR